MNSLAVISDAAPPSPPDADGDARNNIRVEILPSFFSNTTAGDNTSGRAKNQRIYSLGIVFNNSGGERPAGLERKQAEVGGPEPDSSQDQNGTVELLDSLDALPSDQGQNDTEELLESLDPLPLNQGDGKIDIDGVDIDDFDLFRHDDLQDEYNDIWGLNNDTDGSLQDQNPKKKSSSTSNDFVMRAVSVEPLNTSGVPGRLCDLISNNLLNASR